jgi:short-subunit dehydrogenase
MKNVVITGSTRGIGLCMAREFLKHGCNVTVSGRSEKSFEVAKRELAQFSDRILYVPCNVRLKEELENLWKVSVEKWGQVDFWINNAGQNSPYEFSYDIEEQYVDALIETNIKGLIFGSQVAARNMLSQGSGQIWNMEGLGSNGMIQIKTILYGTSKRALTYFTQALAKELEGKPVLVGRLSPGMMLTDFITKTPDGESSPVIKDQNFQKIFNILADKPETVAEFFIPRILENKDNDAHIVWLTHMKSMIRFATAPFNKRKLI